MNIDDSFDDDDDDDDEDENDDDDGELLRGGVRKLMRLGCKTKQGQRASRAERNIQWGPAP